ncbi:MAG: hypothetical protein JRI73_00520 [Deltaproteobacteria bacterium]|nr:hypothetical protein [Deltaproteobacteria bacterium]
MGTNLLLVHPGQRGFRGVMSDTSQRLKLSDAKAILEGIPNVYQVAPVVRGQVQLKYILTGILQSV